VGGGGVAGDDDFFEAVNDGARLSHVNFWILVRVMRNSSCQKLSINPPPLFDNQIQQFFRQSTLNFPANRRRITSSNHE
jgi:hypothetical protein